jgi:hypothetical protein
MVEVLRFKKKAHALEYVQKKKKKGFEKCEKHNKKIDHFCDYKIKIRLSTHFSYSLHIAIL